MREVDCYFTAFYDTSSCVMTLSMEYILPYMDLTHLVGQVDGGVLEQQQSCNVHATPDRSHTQDAVALLRRRRRREHIGSCRTGEFPQTAVLLRRRRRREHVETY